MIDVGAHWGSSLLAFAQQSWTVHAFEPDPLNCARLMGAIEGLETVTVDPRAVSTTDGKTVSLYTSPISSGISSLDAFHSTHRVTTEVQTVRLDTYIQEEDIERVDFLKIDVEGRDLDVLESFPWATHQPTVVICEFEDRKTTRLGHTYREIAEFLTGHGFDVLISEWYPIVEYGLAHRWRRAVRYPAEISAESWGNLIAGTRALPAVERELRRAQYLGRPGEFAEGVTARLKRKFTALTDHRKP